MQQEQTVEVAEILSADVAGVFKSHGTWHVLLIRRPPGKAHEDKLAFPGGRKEEKDGGKIRNTAIREYAEKVGIKITAEELVLVRELDGHGRDPRPGARTSFVFAVVLDEAVARAAVSPEGLEIAIRRLDMVPQEKTAFDHYKGILALRKKYIFGE